MENSDPQKLKRILLIVSTYVLIGLLTLASISIFFKDGVPTGDDIHCHLAQCYDFYYGLKHGFVFPDSNHLIYGSLGGNMIESYAPLPHAAVGLFAFLFEWAGVDIIISYKFLSFVVQMLGGVFMYHFIYHVSHKRSIGFIAGCFFAIAPCRSFLLICRSSFSEMWGLSFLPLLFDGAYTLIEEDPYKKNNFLPLFKIGAAMTLILYSHLLTALLGVTAVIFYILFRIKTVVRIFRIDHSLYYKVPLTVLATVLVTLPYLIPSIYASNSGIYRVGSSSIFKTTYADLVAEIGNDVFHPGWRVFTVANSFGGGDSVASLTFGLILLVLSMLSLIALDLTLKKIKSFPRLSAILIELLLFLVFGLIGPKHIEFYLALTGYFLVYHYISYVVDKEEIKTEKVEEETHEEKLTKGLNLLYFFLSALFTLCLIYVPTIWTLIPKIYYNVQFPFRLFSFLAFFMAAFIPLFLDYAKPSPKVYAPAGAIILSLCLYFCQASFEKRGSTTYFYTSWSEIDCYEGRDGGVQKEYVPITLLDVTYSSPYGKTSLLDEVRDKLSNNTYSNDPKDYLAPVALTGSISEYELLDLNTPNVTYSITLDEDSYIQMGQIYYTGYAIKAISEEGEVTRPVALNQDGLLSYHLEKGTYRLEVTYPGSKAVQASRFGAYLVTSGLLLGLAGKNIFIGRAKGFGLLEK